MGVKFSFDMAVRNRFLNLTVASFLAIGAICGPVRADESPRLERLFAQLQEADPTDALRLAREIELEWSKSGSAAMDLLLRRGNEAIEAGDALAAIEHFTALTDHAPNFAEGWYRRALAYAMADLDGPAMADLQRALALEGRHFDAIASVGAIALRTGREDLARRAFEAALEIYPNHPQATEGLERLDAESLGKDI